MKKFITGERTGLHYELVGDYYLIAGEDEPEEDQPIRVWGQRHLRYLKEHHRVRYANLLTSGELNAYEDDFVKAVMGSTQQNVALDRKLKEKELAALQARDEELDGLFERIYEDNVSGKLSDDRFVKMSRRYEDEQKEISEKIKTLRAEMDKLSSKSVTADMFISTVRKYTRAKVLTPRMLNELIDHIEVHQAEKIDGIWEQHLVIHYNCVGVIFIPDVFPLPAPQVSVNTRKGVVVNYAPGQLAV